MTMTPIKIHANQDSTWIERAIAAYRKRFGEKGPQPAGAACALHRTDPPHVELRDAYGDVLARYFIRRDGEHLRLRFEEREAAAA